MTQDTSRIRRLVEDELDGCCDADVDRRLAELDALDGSTTRDGGDLVALKALANDTRYRIVRLLAAAEGELCVCEFDVLLDVSESATSHALSRLADAGLVSRRKDGRWRYYRATERAERLVEALEATRGAER
jgi:DNA-binding transcriptional ArsR family regulator